MLSTLFHWTNLLFLLPTLLGVVCFVLCLGFDSEADSDDSIFPSKLLSACGLEHLPIIFGVAPTLCFFGTVGLATNGLLGTTLPGDEWQVVFSLVETSFITLGFSHTLGLVLKRHVPLIESSATSMTNKIGLQGQTLIDTTPFDGLVLFTDQGDVYQLRAVSSSETIPKNSSVVIVDYDTATNTCTVCPLP